MKNLNIELHVRLRRTAVSLATFYNNKAVCLLICFEEKTKFLYFFKFLFNIFILF